MEGPSKFEIAVHLIKRADAIFILSTDSQSLKDDAFVKELVSGASRGYALFASERYMRQLLKGPPCTVVVLEIGTKCPKKETERLHCTFDASVIRVKNLKQLYAEWKLYK